MALIPQIVDVVRAPVIAAGGITDGRGIAAAFALGASGALMGDIVKATTEKGSGEYFPMYAGQGVGSLRDLPRAADVVQSLVREAQAVITGLHHRVKSA